MLPAYADRGVFRAFRPTPLGRGRTSFDFQWLLGRPMFDALFPGLQRSSRAARGLNAIVAMRSSPRQPAHKRLDRRRADVSGTIKGGDWSLVVTVRGRNHAYAVRHALNLVNELFLFLHESYPEYLIERFGLSPE